jgi:hypothetical protein
MFVLAGRRDELAQALTKLLQDVSGHVAKELQGIRSVVDLADKVKSLRAELERLELEKERKDETFARKERELEHMVGLERKRQEFELQAAKREAILSVGEANLQADRRRFEEQMAFHDKRFSEEVGYLKTIISDLAERLPTMKMTTKLERKE